MVSILLVTPTPTVHYLHSFLDGALQLILAWHVGLGLESQKLKLC
jgi:hypothetical protein